MPTQGFSASIMRKAVQLAQDRGLSVVFTLHDAIYIEFVTLTESHHVGILAECMDEAFRFYFNDTLKDRATCRMEADVWGPDYKEVSFYSVKYNTRVGELEMEVKQQEVYLDPRGKEEYYKYETYFRGQDYANLRF